MLQNYVRNVKTDHIVYTISQKNTHLDYTVTFNFNKIDNFILHREQVHPLIDKILEIFSIKSLVFHWE